MASLVTYNNGLRRIDFKLSNDGPRRSIRLGRLNAKNARSIHTKIEQLISDKLTQRPHDPELAQWLASLDEKLLSRLRSAGLANGVGVTQISLGEFLEKSLASLAVKPATRTFYGHTKRNLQEYFKPNRLLSDITPADADAWRAWLANEQGLSSATVGRRVVAARTLWRKAIRWKLVSENPFDGIKGGSQENESRKRFVDQATIDRVIEHASDAEWRLLIGLSRYGGLRCPSEHLSLRWTDIDWDRSVLVVRSAKTEHHGGHGTRQVPLFPELRSLLLDVYELAEPGSEHVITRYREATQNLRTQFQRIIRRAGVEPWPRLWQNLRASRESELMRDYDLTTVCRWIGNSPVVAARHYATSIDRDADFRRAVARPEAAGGNDSSEEQQKTQQSAAVKGGQH